MITTLREWHQHRTLPHYVNVQSALLVAWVGKHNGVRSVTQNCSKCDGFVVRVGK